MKRLLRLYPSAWRARYEAEVAELLDELPTNRSMLLDLIRGAVVERARAAWRLLPVNPVPAGGPPMLEHPLQRHPTSLALLALVMVTPTFLFVFVSLLAYQISVPGLATAVEPALQALTAPGWVDLFLLGAPFVAFLVAVLPLVGLGWGRTDGELHLTLSLRARALNLAVLVLCVLLGGLLIGHLITEFMYEAAR
ncbi:MAG TPA: hypothetical protein VMK30_05965 [Pleomorphomonadaceae bacterium]|nr:hypothetical protein [Pleomorphomonadaceae bacterium]